jgi:hypothetical protein
LNELPLGAVYKRAPFSGILGDIHFLMGGRAGIKSVVCFPDFEADRITIETKFWNPKNYKADLQYILTAPDGTTGTLPKFIKLEKENDTYSITFSLDNAVVWSPETPHLYKVTVNLLGSYSFDLHFGLRRVEVERCNIRVNHMNRRIRGVNFLQVFPFYHAVPSFEYDLQKDLSLIKESGFNLIRSGGVPLSTPVLDICDKLGLMVIQETTCFNQKSSKDGLEELKNQIESLVRSTGYHPSVIAWGIGAENGSMVLENGNKLLRFTCELDPYRPIISNFNSVYLDSNGLGKIDLGKVFNPTDAKIEPFESHKLRTTIPVSTRTQNLLTNYCSSKDAKSVNDRLHGNKSFWERYNYLKDELGGKIIINGLGADVPLNIEKILSNRNTRKLTKHEEANNLKELKRQLKNAVEEISIWKDKEAFLKDTSKICLEGTINHIESLLINPQISGYVFENWADFGNDFSGLVDWYREPKPNLESIKKLNQRCKIMSETEVRTPYMGTSAAINIYMLNENILQDYSLLIRVKGPNGRIWHQESMPGKAKSGLNSIGRFKFPVGMEKGWFTFDLTLSQGKREIDKKEVFFYVPPKINLEPLLQSSEFIGNFPDTITYASNQEATITIANDIRAINKNRIISLFDNAKNGGTLVLGTMKPEDANVINETRVLPFGVSCFRSSRSPFGSFHYLKKCATFKDVPANRLMGEAFADITPTWSINTMRETDILAGSINLLDKDIKQKKVLHGTDAAVLKYGKGKVVFYQLEIFNKLGKSALADLLLFNLLSMDKK